MKKNNISSRFVLIFSLLLLISTQLYSTNAPIFSYKDRFHPVVSKHGMVVSQEKEASEVGAAILADGGNAIDAAVAIGFALSATLPRAGNLGGGGFMLIYDAASKRVRAIDYREKAPLKSKKDMFFR
jgi:Gamma-glutamyltransferase